MMRLFTGKGNQKDVGEPGGTVTSPRPERTRKQSRYRNPERVTSGEATA